MTGATKLPARRRRVREPLKLVAVVDGNREPDVDRIDAAVLELIHILARAAAQEFVEAEMPAQHSDMPLRKDSVS